MSDYDRCWNCEDELSDIDGLDIIQPDWMDSVSPSDVAAIYQGGCASGAYMPAVTYHKAAETMAEHGDDVLQFIEEYCGELPTVPTGNSWSGIAVFFLSYAVELWAGSVIDDIDDHLESLETEEDESEEDET